MDNKKIFKALSTLDKFPIEAIFAKMLWLNGFDSEQKITEELKKYPTLSQPKKVAIQNSIRDIEIGFYDINKIPTLFK